MTRAACTLAALALLAAAPGLAAQARAPEGGRHNAALARAAASYADLAFSDAIGHARGALRGRLDAAEQVRAYEILGFAYAALDSARQATEAFRQLVLLDPDRQLDPARISPKITTLYALAMGQVLVVRGLEADSAAFVAGAGQLPFRFAVTRAARVSARIAGPAGSVVVDSGRVEGATRLTWGGLLADGSPAPSGRYRIIVEASAGRDSYAASLPIRVEAGAVDTLAHLASLPGYELLPETVVPPRSWRPFAMAMLAAGTVAGASVALESAQLGTGGRRELLTVGVGTAVVGLLAAVKRPAPVASTANVRYNALVREQLGRRNAAIAAENARRRRQVRLSIAPERARPALREGGQ